MTARRSPAAAEGVLKASVQQLADRVQRVASMLDRWETEVVAGEPEWDAGDIEPLALQPPTRS